MEHSQELHIYSQAKNACLNVREQSERSNLSVARAITSSSSLYAGLAESFPPPDPKVPSTEHSVSSHSKWNSFFNELAE